MKCERWAESDHSYFVGSREMLSFIPNVRGSHWRVLNKGAKEQLLQWIKRHFGKCFSHLSPWTPGPMVPLCVRLVLGVEFFSRKWGWICFPSLGCIWTIGSKLAGLFGEHGLRFIQHILLGTYSTHCSRDWGCTSEESRPSPPLHRALSLMIGGRGGEVPEIIKAPSEEHLMQTWEDLGRLLIEGKLVFQIDRISCAKAQRSQRNLKERHYDLTGIENVRMEQSAGIHKLHWGD